MTQKSVKKSIWEKKQQHRPEFGRVMKVCGGGQDKGVREAKREKKKKGKQKEFHRTLDEVNVLAPDLDLSSCKVSVVVKDEQIVPKVEGSEDVAVSGVNGSGDGTEEDDAR
ncbi:hypothetical protein VNO78_07942 [Psophocarpus tetragonolobus]|uniref:Uncharacterized protein n=1 Tax=Psophocarpus tetragonolobus TaxID=3891 RepID=A0AAN9SX22_PSOTE